ncbi:MAG: hypothetical protein LBP71_01385 [Spirochaetaceae bacterium]|jgi:hypothetical protein|nr:hypothetical protein [Spirochaetaceae bacterium]
MAHKKDYVPVKDADFDVWFRNLCQYVNAKCNPPDAPQWSHIPPDALTELNGAYAAWHAAYGITLKPCTKPERDEKNRVRKGSQKTARNFVNAYLRYHPAVTDDDREQMGLRIPDPASPIPRPEAQPEADITYPGVHLIELTRIRAVKTEGEDPRSDYGVRIFWGILGPAVSRDKFRLAAPPVTGDDLPHSTFTHRKRYRFDFPGDSGSTVYFCLRYENEKGGEEGEGPFGPILSAIIP